MKPNKVPNPFLDTSVVRKTFISDTRYKGYLDQQLSSNKRYVTPYIRMEFLQGFIQTLAQFYFHLKDPYFATIGDSLATWANRFQIRQVKVGLEIATILFSEKGISSTDPGDKGLGIQALGDFLMQCNIEFQSSFTNCGQNISKCKRGEVPLEYEAGKSRDEVIEEFLAAFDNHDFCRSHCSIDQVIGKPQLPTLQRIIQKAGPLSSARENAGFKRVAEAIDERLQGKVASTCGNCGAVGDAVIAIECPADMNLFTLDGSFDHLAPITGKVHKKLLSPSAYKKAWG